MDRSMFADAGLRGAARLWYAKNLADGGMVPYARDAPSARAGDGAADQILLFGNGPAHGWGVATHQLALTGEIARTVSARTGRAADVTYIGEELMNSSSALPWLGTHDLSGYDAVVVVLGMNDAVRLTPVDRWEQDLKALLDHMRSGLHGGVPIVVSGIQPVDSVPPYQGFFARLGQRRATAMNTATSRIVQGIDDAVFVPLGPPDVEADRPYGSATMYRAWADTYAAVAAPVLDAQHSRTLDRRRTAVAATTWDWPPAPIALTAAADRGTPELRRLVNAAKLDFSVTLAVVTLLNADRMWFAAASAGTPVAIPRSLSYDQHVPSDAGLVVPNAGNDPRFRDNPFILQSHLPFYAGYPVHDRSGRMIGTFCVLAAQPRSATSVPMDALAAYARQAERELQRIELDVLNSGSAR
jgi:lysophospholipase L1-like esterase